MHNGQETTAIKTVEIIRTKITKHQVDLLVALKFVDNQHT